MTRYVINFLLTSIFVVINSSVSYAGSTTLDINISPIICSIDNVNNGVGNTSYLTPQNCSNYYQLFPPVQDNQNNTQKPAKYHTADVIKEDPPVIVKKPATYNENNNSSAPIIDSINEDPVFALLTITCCIALGLSLYKFYKKPN